MKKISVLSYGGGVQTSALVILIAQGKFERPDAIVFADPGSEFPETYTANERMGRWLAQYDMEIVTVKSKEAGGIDLYTHASEKSPTIPVRVGNNEGLSPRQCTRQFKITPVQKYAFKELGGDELETWLGISMDEWHRMKDARDKHVTNRFPLIELGLSREDCRGVILDAGLPEVPNSACYFCPLLGTKHFRRLAGERPDLFEKSAQLEDKINATFQEPRGKKPLYLTGLGRPLRTIPTGQLGFGADFDASYEEECEGTCFV